MVVWHIALRIARTVPSHHCRQPRVRTRKEELGHIRSALLDFT
jgi:hypothetical protein